MADDIKPQDISVLYSAELLNLISAMLSSERDARPTATQVKDQLTAIALQLFHPKTVKCRACAETFPSRNQLTKHLKKTGHNRSTAVKDLTVLPAPGATGKDNDLRVRGCAEAPAQYYYDEEDLDVVNPSPCAVCHRHFDTKRQFFGHLLGGPHHYRSAKYVQKRKAENELNIDVEKEDERLTKWIRKDMLRHDV
jgi:hypothetical protein